MGLENEIGSIASIVPDTKEVLDSSLSKINTPEYAEEAAIYTIIRQLELDPNDFSPTLEKLREFYPDKTGVWCEIRAIEELFFKKNYPDGGEINLDSIQPVVHRPQGRGYRILIERTHEACLDALIRELERPADSHDEEQKHRTNAVAGRKEIAHEKNIFVLPNVTSEGVVRTNEDGTATYFSTLHLKGFVAVIDNKSLGQ